MHTTSDTVLADHLLACSDRARTIDVELRDPSLDVAAAERIQRLIRERRIARGERPAGYKIGFTNRRIWPLYGVDTPIWGPVWAGTTESVYTAPIRLDASRHPLPRLEPEIVIGIARPPAGSDDASLCEAIDWIAHGVELVQSVYPGWKFSAAESIASQAMHGSLHIGQRVDPGDRGTLAARLAALRLVLERHAPDADRWETIAEGQGADVLDGPVAALGHLVRCLRERGVQLAAGDVVSTGTLVDAQPLVAGQRWRTRLDHADTLRGLAGLTIRIA